MSFAARATGALGCLLAVATVAACGEATVGSGANAPTTAAKVSAPADPRSTADLAGAARSATDSSGSSAGATTEVADPLEAESYPSPASVQHASAATPAKAGESIVAAGAPSNAEIRSELKEMESIKSSEHQAQKLDLTPVPGGESIGGNGTIPIPSNVPEVVQKVIAGANEIADFPYVYGGGHASFVDNAYDCSGSVSYALAAGGLLSRPEVSGELESWGAPGPGKYITVYANVGHTYMYVDGILYDTAGRSSESASRWQVEPTDNEGYVARHWPGL